MAVATDAKQRELLWTDLQEAHDLCIQPALGVLLLNVVVARTYLYFVERHERAAFRAARAVPVKKLA